MKRHLPPALARLMEDMTAPWHNPVTIAATLRAAAEEMDEVTLDWAKWEPPALLRLWATAAEQHQRRRRDD